MVHFAVGFGIFAGFLGGLISASMLFLILWQDLRSRQNQLAGMIFAGMMLWSVNASMWRVALLIEVDPTIYYRATIFGMLVTMVTPFFLSVHTAGPTLNPLVRAFVPLGVVYLCAGLFVQLSGDRLAALPVLSPDGGFRTRALPAGYVMWLIGMVHLVASAVLLRLGRGKLARAFFPGVMVLVIAMVGTVTPVLSTYTPILMGSAACVLMGHAILREKLFNPIAEMNAHLSASKRILETKLKEQTRAEKRLREAHRIAKAGERSKSLFIATMGHELRTPLNVILAFGELLEEEAEGEGAARRKADILKIQGAARHLLDVIANVLELSKLEMGAVEIQRKDVDVGDQMDDLYGVAQILAARKENVLTIDGHRSVGTISMDATHLKQILYNLIGNAAKFTERGRIDVDVKRETDQHGQDWVVFRVKDTGPGISAEKLPGLFREFYQVDHVPARAQGGTGLGLAISRRLCRLMGGDIEVESVLGKGTTFTVRLPVEARASLAP